MTAERPDATSAASPEPAAAEAERPRQRRAVVLVGNPAAPYSRALRIARTKREDTAAIEQRWSETGPAEIVKQRQQFIHAAPQPRSRDDHYGLPLPPDHPLALHVVEEPAKMLRGHGDELSDLPLFQG